MDGVRARVALYVNKKIDPAKWTHTTVSPDYQVLRIQHLRGEEAHDLYIHNIYNEPKSPTFDLLNRELSRIGRSRTIEHLILGDMNVHHPAWGNPGTKIDSGGTDLLRMRVPEEGIYSRYRHARIQRHIEEQSYLRRTNTEQMYSSFSESAG